MRRLQPHMPIPADARGAAIALGNFDGVHVGHQAVIASARTEAEARGVALGVVVFEPHPRRFFQPDAPPFRLQTPVQRARTLGHLGVSEVFEIAFDAALTQMHGEAFAEEVLKQRIGAVHVSVGDGFRFGRGRSGDAASLKQLGGALGFGVDVAQPVELEGARISSSAIRAAISGGDMQAARTLLGRPWAIEGVVQRGFARGRGFGFATANLDLGAYVRPHLGIYAVRVDIGDGRSMPGVASIGVNPTVGALPEPVLEAHLFDFDDDLYDRSIEVALVAFLRDEARFEDIAALKRQMAQDAQNARAALKS